MSSNIPYPRYKGWKANGVSPAAGYYLYTYNTGTTIPKTTWSDAALSVPNANPIVLDANGEASIFVSSGSYRFDLKTSAGALINTFDPVNGSGSASGGSSVTVVDSIADLRALAVSTPSTVLVLGYYAATDGRGGGVFYFDTTSTDADDNGMTLLPNSAPATGRWKRKWTSPVAAHWFGYVGDNSGIVPDATAIAAAVAFVNSIDDDPDERGYSYEPGFLNVGADFSVGSIATPVFKVDQTNSIVNTSYKLGVGFMTTPEKLAHFAGESLTENDMILQSSNGSTLNSVFRFRKSRGTIAVPTNIVNTDQYGVISAEGYSGGSWWETAAIRLQVAAAIVDGQRPASSVSIDTNANNAAAVTAVTWDKDGKQNQVFDFSVNTNKFTVAASSGNTVIAGTLNIASSVLNTVLVGTGNRITTSSATGVLGNSTTIDGNYTFTGTITGAVTLANPTGTIGLTAVNGVATTAPRSDSAPALSEAIAPTWSAKHIFSNGLEIATGGTANVGSLTYDATNGFQLRTLQGSSYDLMIISRAGSQLLRVDTTTQAWQFQTATDIYADFRVWNGVANKFTVASSTGNTVIAGTLALTSDLAINTNKFTVTASSGNTIIAGTLGVTGLLTYAASIMTESALTDAATIAVDASLSNSYTVTLAGNRTLGSPTNAAAGRRFTVRIRQDATGSRTLAYNAIYRFPGGVTPVLTTTAAKTDYLTFQYHSTDTKWDLVGSSFNL